MNLKTQLQYREYKQKEDNSYGYTEWANGWLLSWGISYNTPGPTTIGHYTTAIVQKDNGEVVSLHLQDIRYVERPSTVKVGDSYYICSAPRGSVCALGARKARGVCSFGGSCLNKTLITSE